jgi:hypothetical protein
MQAHRAMKAIHISKDLGRAEELAATHAGAADSLLDERRALRDARRRHAASAILLNHMHGHAAQKPSERSYEQVERCALSEEVIAINGPFSGKPVELRKRQHALSMIHRDHIAARIENLLPTLANHC